MVDIWWDRVSVNHGDADLRMVWRHDGERWRIVSSDLIVRTDHACFLITQGGK